MGIKDQAKSFNPRLGKAQGKGRSVEQNERNSSSGTRTIPLKHHGERGSNNVRPPGAAVATLDTPMITMDEYQPHNSLLVQLNEKEPKWYKYGRQHHGAERNATIETHPPPGLHLTANTKHSQQQLKRPAVASAAASTPALIHKYRILGDAIYQREVQLFQRHQQQHANGKDDRWMEATLKRGTLKDRIAAHSVLISDHPVQHLMTLDGLLNMAGCRMSSSSSSSSSAANSRVAQLAAEALHDLFLHTLMPPHRKLITLAQRPLYLYERNNTTDPSTTATSADALTAKKSGGKKTKKNKNKNGSNDSDNNAENDATITTTLITKKTLSPRLLLLWRFEEMLKDRYQAFIQQYIAYTLREAVEDQKNTAIRCAATLLCALPEAEQALLLLLVNKLGDPARKVAAAAAHELRRALVQHPAMMPIIAREVQQLVHRPHLSSRALYNCITFLNQLELRKSKPEGKADSLPASLIKTYFRLFEVAIHKTKQIKDSQAKRKTKNKNSSHTATDVDTTTTSVEYESAMRSRLLSALLTGVNRAHPFLARPDADMQQHIDALYRVAHVAPPAARTQALLLLFHLAIGYTIAITTNAKQQQQQQQQTAAVVASVPPDLSKDIIVSVHDKIEKQKGRDRFYRALYATLSDMNMVSSGKHLTMFFNLLYKSMKYDTDVSRIVAFSKSLQCTVVHCSSPIQAATLFLLQEIAKVHGGLSSCWNFDNNNGGRDGIDDVCVTETDRLRVLDYTKREPRGAFHILDAVVHEANNISNKESFEREEDTNDDTVDTNTDGDTRSNNKVTLAPAWELNLLLNHFHPSVQAFASNMPTSSIVYNGDPLKDFTLMTFLDKFAYRNPKSAAKVAAKYHRGLSVAERHSGTNRLVQVHMALPVNDPTFMQQPGQAVEAHDVFFHQFFVEQARRDEVKGIVRYKARKGDHRDNNNDDDSDNDMGEADVDDKLEALDKAEQRNVDDTGGNFNYEWDTDEEEEAFVNSLAEKLMEDAVDLDEEDPDTEGWDDMYKGEEGDDNGSQEEGEDEDGIEEDDTCSDREMRPKQSKVPKNVDDDDDAFMDMGDDDDGKDDGETSSNGSEPAFLDGEDQDVEFASDRSESSSDDEGNVVAAGAADEDDDDDDDLGFAAILDDSDHSPVANEDEDPIGTSKSSNTLGKSNSKKELSLPAFADAADYEERINQSWNALKRQRTTADGYDDDDHKKADSHDDDDDDDDDKADEELQSVQRPVNAALPARKELNDKKPVTKRSKKKRSNK